MPIKFLRKGPPEALPRSPTPDTPQTPDPPVRAAMGKLRVLWHDTYGVVVDERGKPVAQGSKELCERVMRDGPY
jgi:hypothetical protein